VTYSNLWWSRSYSEITNRMCNSIRRILGTCIFSRFVWQNEKNVLDNNTNKFSKKYDVNDMIRRVCKLICMYSRFRSVANRKQHTENDILINNPEIHYLSTCIYLMVVRCSLHYDQFAYFNIYSSFLFKHQIHSLLKPNVWYVFVIFVLARILRSLIKSLFWIKVNCIF
jgi:hypothetical protein